MYAVDHPDKPAAKSMFDSGNGPPRQGGNGELGEAVGVATGPRPEGPPGAVVDGNVEEGRTEGTEVDDDLSVVDGAVDGTVDVALDVVGVSVDVVVEVVVDVVPDVTTEVEVEVVDDCDSAGFATNPTVASIARTVGTTDLRITGLREREDTAHRFCRGQTTVAWQRDLNTGP